MKSLVSSFFIILFVFWGANIRLIAQTAVLPASVDVSAIGAATYTIPIDVVPGTGGMQPSLAITYNSLGGFGNMGYRWSLTGISSITRVPQSLYYDGKVHPISFDTSDRFALDGRRLILLSGNGYHSTNAIYGQEVEDFSRTVRAWDGLNDYFADTLADGRIAYYGITQNSRLKSSFNTLAWLISRVVDANGNTIHYEYESANGSANIKRIYYVYDSVAPSVPYAQVVFLYDNQIPDNDFYISGLRYSQSKIINQIAIVYQGDTVRRYLFHYDYTLHTPRLTEILLADSEGIPLSPTAIEWNDAGDNGIWDDTVAYMGYQRYFVPGNFNNDRLYDILTIDYAFAPTLKIFQQDASGSMTPINVAGQLPVRADLESLVAADLDGDGVDELLCRSRSAYLDTFYIVSLPTSTGGSLQSQIILRDHHLEQPIFGDFDGDGITDFVVRSSAAIYCYRLASQGVIPNYSMNGYDELLSGDFNGDGKSDLLALSTSGYAIFSFNQQNEVWTQFESGTALTSGQSCIVGDLNGDGLTDIISLPPDSSQWRLSVRKGSTSWLFTNIASLDARRINGTILPLHKPIVCDLNGDGRSDLLQDTNSSISMMLITHGLTNGRYLHAQPLYFTHPAWQTFSARIMNIADFDNDGSPDLLFTSVANSTGSLAIVKHLGCNSIWQTHSITNAFGAENIFEYGNLSLMPDRYAGDGLQWTSYPVVKNLLRSDGIGGYDTSRYYYGEACFDYTTHSFLGFKHFGVFRGTQMTEHTFSRVGDGSGNEYPLLQPTGSATYLVVATNPSSLPGYVGGQAQWHSSSDTAITSTSRKISVVKHSTASAVPVFLPYISLDTTINYLNNTRTISSVSLNSQWRPSQQITTIYPNIGNSTAVSFVQRSYQYTVTTLSNGVSIVQPSRKTEYTAFGTSIIEIFNERRDFTDYYYNAQGLLSCIIHSDNGGYCDTTRYTYNSHGLPLRISKTPAGCATRYTDNQYDATSRFVVSQTDIEGNSVQASYDGATGLKTSETDINGISIHYEYDSLGRITLRRRPDGTATHYQYRRITGNFPNAVWSMLESEEMRPSKRTYYDMLGRAVHTFIDGQGYRDVDYNHLGQVSRLTLMPYEEVSTPDADKVWETRNYDAYGRPTKTESYYVRNTYAYPPAGSYTSSNYRYHVGESLKTGAFKTTYYDAAGRVVQVVDNGGTINYRYSGKYNLETFRQKTLIIYGSDTTTIVADSRDHRLSISDPDGGTITSTYDGWGQLTHQTDANGNVTTYTYDALGRIATSRTIPSGGMGITLPVKYTYYTTNTATSRRIGKLQKVSDAIRTYRTFDYDTLGRLVSETNRINNTSYTQSYSYDSYGRLYTITYPSGFVLRHEYDLLGELDILRNHTTGEQIYYIDRFTYLRQPQRAWYGNNTGVEYEYNAYGLPVRLQYGYKIDSSPRSDPGIDSIGGGGIIGPLHPGDPYSVGNEYSRSLYEYNSRGRIISRYDTKCNQMEDYFYDNLSRLKIVIVNGYQTRTYQYAANGDMTKNTFVGTQSYTYGGDQPHAVTGVTSTSGNIAPSQCQVTYNKFNRPASISEGDYTLSLTCQSSPHLDQAILKKNGTAVCTTLYISSISECEKTAYNTRYIDYIYAGAIPVAVHVKNVFLQTDSIYYVQTDLLGSWERIVDADKQVVQASHFDPWGNRMKATQWHVADTARSFPFRRGFTGHEHYDRFRIINTGARLYDPVIARFFSPDPYVQDPFSTQSFNRYSYCWNNPVMYTDPTGEFALLTGIVIGVIASIAAGMINVGVHASNGTLNSIGDGLAYLGTGMLGFTLRVGTTTLISLIGSMPTLTGISASTLYASSKAVSATTTSIALVSDFDNASKTIAGRYYYSEKHPHGLLQALSRNTIESIQQWAGYNYTQLRIIKGEISRVDFMGGVTFATEESWDDGCAMGVTLGSYANIWTDQQIYGSFKNYIKYHDEDKLFLHEFGHTFDSQIWGWLYLPVIGAPSAYWAMYGSGDLIYTEKWANRHSSWYFDDIEWDDERNPRHSQN